jgi:hypothetical protein
MPHTLADLPLDFRPKQQAKIGVYVLLIVLELVFAAVFETKAKWPLAAFLTTNGLITTLAFLFMVAVPVFGIVQAVRSQDHLLIDDTGVILKLDNVERRWRWRDMARFHLVLVHKRSKLHMVAIELKSDAAFDAKANVIWPRFGPNTDEFLALLQAGKARWGE